MGTYQPEKLSRDSISLGDGVEMGSPPPGRDGLFQGTV